MKPLCVIGIGNEARGDDALGPLLLRKLAAASPRDVICLEAFQLAPEHCLDLQASRATLVIDAHLHLAQAAQLHTVKPSSGLPFVGHHLHPAALAALSLQLGGCPPLSVLSLQGQQFELGQGLSPAAERALQQGWCLLQSWLQHQECAVSDA